MTRDTFEAIMRYYQRKNNRLSFRMEMERDSVEAFRLRRAIRCNQSKLLPMQNFLGHKDSPDGQWVTMNGTHVLIEEGKVVGGPPNLKGKPHKPKQKSGSAGEGQTENSVTAKSEGQPKREYHPEVSETDRRKLSKYAAKMKREGELIVARDSKTDESVKAVFGESTMTTSEFAERSMAAIESWNEEDRLLDAAYTCAIDGVDDSLGIKFDELNRKLREGQSLTDNEQSVVDHFRRCAEPLKRDTDLYRMVGKDYLESILSVAGVSDIQQLVGETITNEAIQSTCAGVNSFFKLSDVAIKIKAPATAKVCFTSDVGEGEIVIPPGAKMRIVKVNTSRPASLKDMETERDPRTVLPIWETVRGAYGGGSDTNAKICGFRQNSGRQSINGVYTTRAKTYIEMELVE